MERQRDQPMATGTPSLAGDGAPSLAGGAVINNNEMRGAEAIMAHLEAALCEEWAISSSFSSIFGASDSIRAALERVDQLGYGNEDIARRKRHA
jgi:hypothetical protein